MNGGKLSMIRFSLALQNPGDPATTSAARFTEKVGPTRMTSAARQNTYLGLPPLLIRRCSPSSTASRSPGELSFQPGWNQECAFTFNRDAEIVIDICAYAEYYGCLDRIAPHILDLLFAHPLFWKAVADKPERYFALGKKLRCPIIYFDAMRHWIGSLSAGNYRWAALGEALGMSGKESEDLYLPLLYEQAMTIFKLKDDLLRLQLTPCWISYDRKPLPVYTTFFNALSAKRSDRSDYAKARSRFNYLARSTYGAMTSPEASRTEGSMDLGQRSCLRGWWFQLCLHEAV